MRFKGVELVCPHCRGELERPAESEIVCHKCQKKFPVILDIPDLRIFPDHYQDVETERQKAYRIAERFDDFDFAGLVDFYYSITDVVTPELAKKYKASLFAAVPRTEAWLTAWEERSGTAQELHLRNRALLDLGCGTGALLLAAQDKYAERVGVDIAFRWLMMCKKRLSDAKQDLPLICACAEALPLVTSRFDTVALDSVIEHFSEQGRALNEIYRVMKPGARLYIATPNQRSLGPDPATKIWAGSWLPERVTAWLVLRKGGLVPKRHLLNAGSLRRLLESTGLTEIEVYLPAVPAEQRAHFPALMRGAMAAYDAARKLPVSRHVLRAIGPMLHAVARRRPESFSEQEELCVTKKGKSRGMIRKRKPTEKRGRR